MARTPRLLVAACTALVTAVMACPHGVHAADGDSDSGTFVGHIDMAFPIPLVGGPADPFAYGGVACDGVSSDGEFGACDLAMPGPNNFFNLACGSGVALGVVMLGEPQDGAADAFNVEVILVGGVGVIFGGASGVVQIAPDPTAPTPPVGTCGQHFIVAGSAVAG